MLDEGRLGGQSLVTVRTLETRHLKITKNVQVLAIGSKKVHPHSHQGLEYWPQTGS